MPFKATHWQASRKYIFTGARGPQPQELFSCCPGSASTPSKSETVYQKIVVSCVKARFQKFRLARSPQTQRQVHEHLDFSFQARWLVAKHPEGVEGAALKC